MIVQCAPGATWGASWQPWTRASRVQWGEVDGIQIGREGIGEGPLWADSKTEYWALHVPHVGIAESLLDDDSISRLLTEKAARKAAEKNEPEWPAGHNVGTIAGGGHVLALEWDDSDLNESVVEKMKSKKVKAKDLGITLKEGEPDQVSATVEREVIQ